MDSPIPPQSSTSNMDYLLPLFVDTNIVYEMDEARFPGLQEGPHSFERSLIIDSGIPLNSHDEGSELTDTLTTVESQDLYNLIDSMNVEELMLFPTDSANILDLPGIQLDHRINDIADNTDVYTSSNGFHMDNLTTQMNFVPEESVDSLQINQEKRLEESPTYDDIQSTINKTQHQMSSCRFTSSRRKRRFSSTDDTAIPFQTEKPSFTKRRKLDLNEICWSSFSIKGYCDTVIDDNFSEISFYPESRSCDSPVNRFNVRQC